MKTIPESDWKTLKSMKDKLLQIECECALHKVDRIIKRSSEKAHEAYLEIWSVLKDEDERISCMFDDLRRSNATLKLTEMVRNGLLPYPELESFTEETRNTIEAIIGVNKGVQSDGAARRR